MVDQNSNAQTPPSSSHPEASHSASASEGMSAPSVVKAGEIMLILSLVLIFLVCFFVALHFHLRRQKRKKRQHPRSKKKGKKTTDSQQPELHSQEKNVAELVGTPICEMGDSEPRHEMEDVEVHEQHTIDLEAQVHTETSSMTTITERDESERAEPEVRQKILINGAHAFWTLGLEQQPNAKLENPEQSPNAQASIMNDDRPPRSVSWGLKGVVASFGDS